MTYILNLLLAHFVGDWWLQPRWMATQKSSSIKVLLQHLFRVVAVLAVPVLLFHPGSWYLLFVYALLHGLQDWFLWKGYKADLVSKFQKETLYEPAIQKRLESFEYWKDKRFYDIIAVDQFLHLALIFILFT